MSTLYSKKSKKSKNESNEVVCICVTNNWYTCDKCMYNASSILDNVNCPCKSTSCDTKKDTSTNRRICADCWLKPLKR